MSNKINSYTEIQISGSKSTDTFDSTCSSKQIKSKVDKFSFSTDYMVEHCAYSPKIKNNPNYVYMSTTDSSIPLKKNIVYSTNYMVEYLNKSYKGYTDNTNSTNSTNSTYSIDSTNSVNSFIDDKTKTLSTYVLDDVKYLNYEKIKKIKKYNFSIISKQDKKIKISISGIEKTNIKIKIINKILSNTNKHINTLILYSKNINFVDLNIPNHINSYIKLHSYTDLDEYLHSSNKKNISNNTLIIIDDEINNFYNFQANSTIDKSAASFIVFTSNYINNSYVDFDIYCNFIDNDLYEMDKIYYNCYSQYIDYDLFKNIYCELDGKGFIINDKKNIGHYQIYTEKYKNFNKNKLPTFVKKFNSDKNRNKTNTLNIIKTQSDTDLYSYVKKKDELPLKKNNNLLNDNIKPQNIKFNIGSNINIEINF